jgi:signal transduction histidine kinase
MRFFVNTAHDIRTPLTLIKAPLEELNDRETLTQEGTDNLSTALRNVNALLRLTTNLINFERADTYSNNFYVSEYELGAYMNDTINAFRSYASVKHINSKVTGSGIGLLLVWKLVHIHKGKLNFTSTEGKGSCIKVSFPKGEKRYRKAIHRPVFPVSDSL